MSAFLPPPRPTLLWKALAFISLSWALFVLWGCLDATGTGGGLILSWFPFLRGFEYRDKLVHAGLHGVLASLLWCTGVARAHARQLRWFAGGALAVVLICASYGGLIELLQARFTATRAAEWLDALANTIGAGLAVLFWQFLRGWLLKKIAHSACLQ